MSNIPPIYQQPNFAATQSAPPGLKPWHVFLGIIVVGILAYFYFSSKPAAPAAPAYVVPSSTPYNPYVPVSPSAPFTPPPAQPSLPVKPSPWQCVGGWGFAVRRNVYNDIECYSKNGTDCYGHEPGNAPGACFVPSDDGDPLSCGPDHLGLYQSDGYSTGTWCSDGDAAIPKFPTAQKRTHNSWTDLKEGPGILVRKNAAGDVECLSTDGLGCVVQATGLDVSRLGIPESAVKPLVCGDMHKKLYGFSGYESDGHWCSRAKASLP